MDDFENENNYLMHYGKKGMKWGQWNAETAARYNRVHEPRTIKEGIKTSVSEKIGNIRQSVLRRVSGATKKEATSRGYKKISEYKKARAAALYSNNPAVVSRYASTLTDKELQNKIKRIELEKKVSSMVPPKTKSAGRQAAEKFANDFATSTAKDLSPVVAKFVSKKLGLPTENEKSLNEKYQEAYQMAFAKAAGTKAGSEYYKNGGNTSPGTNSPDGKKKGQQQTVSTSSSNSSSASSKVRDTSPITINFSYNALDVPKSTKDKGSKAIQRVLDDDIIDVVPVSESSERKNKK